MKTDYHQLSLLDIVFENRNKAYGAYVLRRDHDKSLRTAMAFSFSVIFLLLSANFIAEKLKHTAKTHALIDPVVTLTEVKLADKQETIVPKKPDPQPSQPQPKPKPTVANTPMNVVANSEVRKDSIPTVDDLKKAESGLTDNRNAADDGAGVDGGKGTAPSLEAATEMVPVNNDPVWFSEVMPEFPGGQDKLLKFLADHTEYPPMEQEEGITGKVLAEVTVGLDGKISDVHILKSPTPDFSREVTRVAKLIPPFKPGMQAGRPVRVKMVLPFSFTIKH